MDPDYEASNDDEETSGDSSSTEMENKESQDVAPVQAQNEAAAKTRPEKTVRQVRKVTGRTPVAGPDEEIRVYLDPPVERADGDTDKDSGKKITFLSSLGFFVF